MLLLRKKRVVIPFHTISYLLAFVFCIKKDDVLIKIRLTSLMSVLSLHCHVSFSIQKYPYLIFLSCKKFPCTNGYLLLLFILNLSLELSELAMKIKVLRPIFADSASQLVNSANRFSETTLIKRLC
jgi:hypothetical protein